MKDKIIEESIESLRREGLKFSVDTLAERLKVSKKTIYKYFPDKESLAVALYESYYATTVRQAEALIGENTDLSHKKLLSLYFDSKVMTRREIFNKYKLNKAISDCTVRYADSLWNLISASFPHSLSEEDKTALRVIVDGSLEKLCCDGSHSDAVIERLVYWLW